MPCPDGRYGAALFREAVNNFEMYDAITCSYAAPMGELVVGTIVYAGFGLNIFVRTGSVMIPFVLLLILGGTILAQMFAVINSLVGLIVLIAAPLVVSMLVFSIDRRT